MQQGKKTAIITGSARGIGAAAAQRFLAAGYHVIGTDVLVPQSEPKGSWEFHRGDITDESFVKALIAGTAQRHNSIDVLANVAGVVLVKPLVETSWEEFRRLVDVNLGGTFLTMKYVLPIMEKQRSGAIVNMASVSGHVGQIDHGLYGATKSAVIGLCRGLSWEMAPYNIRINSISPGSVDTPMLRGDIEIESRKTGELIAALTTKREAEQAFGRWADPSEIAAAVFFLASDDASFITGTDLKVDCGWTAR